MSARLFSALASVIFAVVAALQLARALGYITVDIVVETVVVPVAASWIAFGVTMVLAWLGFRAAGR